VAETIIEVDRVRSSHCNIPTTRHLLAAMPAEQQVLVRSVFIMCMFSLLTELSRYVFGIRKDQFGVRPLTHVLAVRCCDLVTSCFLPSCSLNEKQLCQSKACPAFLLLLALVIGGAQDGGAPSPPPDPANL